MTPSRLQIQPNRWSCIPTSFSMAIGIPVEIMLDRIGHDGSMVIHRDLPEPRCRRAFHIQECLQVLDFFGYAATPFDAISLLVVDDQHQIELNWLTDFENHLKDANGVLIGEGRHNRHAVAWVDQMVYDPNGHIFGYDELVDKTYSREFYPQTFWKIKSVGK